MMRMMMMMMMMMMRYDARVIINNGVDSIPSQTTDTCFV